MEVGPNNPIYLNYFSVLDLGHCEVMQWIKSRFALVREIRGIAESPAESARIQELLASGAYKTPRRDLVRRALGPVFKVLFPLFKMYLHYTCIYLRSFSLLFTQCVIQREE